ncbi:MAG: ABC transporter permease [Deltaproteobacteria bacterium]|nr:ABC transporter permease [Deltaproteobacteria bacterium]MBW2393872.1 ABC transporter permease [Deltaproteobacteria bacterium]
MSLEFRLAKRNIGRNLRRTGLTVAATVFAVFLVVVFVAMAAGMHEKMIEDGVRIHSGHLQVSGKDYLKKRTLEQFVDLDAELLTLLEQAPGALGVAPRVIGFGLASKGASTQGVAIFGVDPQREGTVSSLPTRVVSGVFVDGEGRGIVLGERLARNLGAEIGDELLLYSVAYSMETAYDLFTVVGTLRLPEPALERTLAVISLADAQAFFAYGDRVSEIAVLAKDAGHVDALEADLHAVLAKRGGPELELHTWAEVMPELKQFIFIDDAGMYIMLAILVVVVAFGILNTILMSVLERTRELGVMLALGLKPGSIFRVVYMESMLLASIGLVIGLALAIPVVLYFQGHPIPMSEELKGAAQIIAMEPVITFKLKPLNPLGSMITILGVAALAALYPALKASRARPVDALRSL